MKPLAALATMAAVVLGLAGVAHADTTRVVVAGPEGDPIASRMQKELGAMGFEPMRVDDASGCTRAGIGTWLDVMHASAAACSDGSTASIWIVSRSGLRMADVVAPEADAKAAPDLIAVRAAEITRASLELTDAETDSSAAPPLTPNRPPPTWTSTPHASAVDAAQGGHAEPAPPPRSPAVAMGGGLAAVMGADATAPSLELELEVRIVRRLGIATRWDVPLQSTSIATPNTTVKIAPAFFAIGPTYALAPRDAFLIPRLSAGVGVVWLRSEAGSVSNVQTNADQFQSTSISTVGHRDDIFSPLAYADASISIRISGPFRIVLDALVGTTAHRMVVRDLGTHVAYWGQPFGALAMRGELVF